MSQKNSKKRRSPPPHGVSKTAVLIDLFRTIRHVTSQFARVAMVGIPSYFGWQIFVAARDYPAEKLSALASILSTLFGAGGDAEGSAGALALLPWMVLAAGTTLFLAGLMAIRYANRRVQELHSRVQKAERLADPRRSSAELTPLGHTKEDDH